MDQAAKEWRVDLELTSFLENEFEFAQNFVIEYPKTAPESSSERVTEAAMDSEENIVDVVSDVQSENAVSKIEKDKSTEMTIAPVSKRKSRKRKTDHLPPSKMVTDFIRALKKHNRALFEAMRKYLQEKYGVDWKLLRYHLGKFLKKHAQNGVLMIIDRVGVVERSKPRKKMTVTTTTTTNVKK